MRISRHVRKLFRPQYILIWMMLAMSLVFWITCPAFRGLDNLLEVVRGAGILAILVLGLTWIVASGEIDISFPEMASFASMLTAICVKQGMSWALAPVVAIAAGTALGLLSGFLITTFRFPSLIATIAVGSVAGAIALFIGKGGQIYVPASKTIDFIVFGKVLGVPLLILIVAGVYLAFSYLQDHTTTGQHLYAIGENRQAALEAGIREKKIVLSFFALSALLASCGGVLTIATFDSGMPLLGGSFFINGLTAVFLGALIVKAGKPNVIGTFIGAVFLAVLENGLTFLGAPSYVGDIIKGVLMIFGVVVIAISRYRISRRPKQQRVISDQ